MTVADRLLARGYLTHVNITVPFMDVHLVTANTQVKYLPDGDVGLVLTAVCLGCAALLLHTSELADEHAPRRLGSSQRLGRIGAGVTRDLRLYTCNGQCTVD